MHQAESSLSLLSFYLFDSLEIYRVDLVQAIEHLYMEFQVNLKYVINY